MGPFHPARANLLHFIIQCISYAAQLANLRIFPPASSPPTNTVKGRGPGWIAASLRAAMGFQACPLQTPPPEVQACLDNHAAAGPLRCLGSETYVHVCDPEDEWG